MIPPPIPWSQHHFLDVWFEWRYLVVDTTPTLFPCPVGFSYCRGWGAETVTSTHPESISKSTLYSVGTVVAIKYPNNIGMVIPILCPFNSPLWLLQKSGRSWKMTMDYCKLSLVTDLTAVALPRVVTLQEQINTALAIWYVIIDLVHFFPHIFQKGD